MNWRGTLTGYGSADIAVYLFFGGVLMLVSGSMEVNSLEACVLRLVLILAPSGSSATPSLLLYS